MCYNYDAEWYLMNFFGDDCSGEIFLGDDFFLGDFWSGDLQRALVGVDTLGNTLTILRVTDGDLLYRSSVVLFVRITTAFFILPTGKSIKDHYKNIG